MRGDRSQRWLLLGATVGTLLLALFAAAWYILLAEKFRPVGGTGIWRSAQLDPDSLEQKIHDLGLHAVINLRGPNPGAPWYDAESARLAALGVPLLDIPLSARHLPEHTRLRELVAALETLPKPLLVHCQHGNDRSGLAALLARLLAGADLGAAEEEISPWRGVLRDDTVGRQFLAQYRLWLAGQGVGHSPELLRAFVAQGYVDADGNLRVVVERVNDRRFKLHGSTSVKWTVGDELQIEGWAFDPESGNPLRSIALQLGGKALGAAHLGLARPDVAESLGDPRMVHSGWRFALKLAQSDRCVPLSMEVTRGDGTIWASPPLGEICLGR